MKLCSEPSSNTPARQMVHMHQKPVSQAKQTSCDKPQTSLTRARILTMCLSPNCLMPESQVYAQNNTSGWWDDRKRNQKPVLPLYLRLTFPAISAEHFLAFAFLATTF